MQLFGTKSSKCQQKANVLAKSKPRRNTFQSLARPRIALSLARQAEQRDKNTLWTVRCNNMVVMLVIQKLL